MSIDTNRTDNGNIVVVDDSVDQRALIRRWLELDGFTVETFPDGESCLGGLASTLPEAICLDLTMPGLGGLETLERISAHHPLLPVVILTADTEVDTVVTAMRRGAFDYMSKPVDRNKLVTVLHNAVRQSRMAVRLVQLEHEVKGWPFGGMLGESAAMHEMFRQIDRLAPTDVSVLILGESGTGKELVATALHENGGRSRGPFVAVNCAAIPETLQESELFGHERGAFTGANARRIGRFEEANGGTLFLDEVGELSTGLQAKLLRALQERRFRRVGGNVDVSSDFRLVAATHRNLAGDVAEGRFREDLYFRIAVYDLEVPPLRARDNDVCLIAENLAHRYGEEHRGKSLAFTPDALEVIADYDWPGNVRELQNAVQRAVISARGDRITAANLPPRIRRVARAGGERPAPFYAGSPPRAAAPPDRDETEEQSIVRALAESRGNASQAARALGIGRATLYRKMKKYGIERS